MPRRGARPTSRPTACTAAWSADTEGRAMGTEVLVPLAIAALSTGAQVYNARRTASKQDAALADSLRHQGARQREADAKVNDQVARLEASNSADERAKREGQYLDALAR